MLTSTLLDQLMKVKALAGNLFIDYVKTDAEFQTMENMIIETQAQMQELRDEITPLKMKVYAYMIIETQARMQELRDEITPLKMKVYAK